MRTTANKFININEKAPIYLCLVQDYVDLELLNDAIYTSCVDNGIDDTYSINRIYTILFEFLAKMAGFYHYELYAIKEEEMNVFISSIKSYYAEKPHDFIFCRTMLNYLHPIFYDIIDWSSSFKEYGCNRGSKAEGDMGRRIIESAKTQIYEALKSRRYDYYNYISLDGINTKVSLYEIMCNFCLEPYLCFRYLCDESLKECNNITSRSVITKLFRFVNKLACNLFPNQYSELSHYSKEYIIFEKFYPWINIDKNEYKLRFFRYFNFIQSITFDSLLLEPAGKDFIFESQRENFIYIQDRINEMLKEYSEK